MKIKSKYNLNISPPPISEITFHAMEKINTNFKLHKIIALEFVNLKIGTFFFLKL